MDHQLQTLNFSFEFPPAGLWSVLFHYRAPLRRTFYDIPKSKRNDGRYKNKRRKKLSAMRRKQPEETPCGGRTTIISMIHGGRVLSLIRLMECCYGYLSINGRKDRTGQQRKVTPPPGGMKDSEEDIRESFHCPVIPINHNPFLLYVWGYLLVRGKTGQLVVSRGSVLWDWSKRKVFCWVILEMRRRFFCNLINEK